MVPTKVSDPTNLISVHLVGLPRNSAEFGPKRLCWTILAEISPDTFEQKHQVVRKPHGVEFCCLPTCTFVRCYVSFSEKVRCDIGLWILIALRLFHLEKPSSTPFKATEVDGTFDCSEIWFSLVVKVWPDYKIKSRFWYFCRLTWPIQHRSGVEFSKLCYLTLLKLWYVFFFWGGGGSFFFKEDS